MTVSVYWCVCVCVRVTETGHSNESQIIDREFEEREREKRWIRFDIEKLKSLFHSLEARP